MSESKVFIAKGNRQIESNGGVVKIWVGEGRGPVNDMLREFDYLSSDDMGALSEFFLHERDQELGRWRWPENPDYVVYPSADGVVSTVHEPTGTQRGFYSRDDADSPPAARAYFAANPEPKPWHDAKHLEIWVLTIQGCPSEAYIYRHRFMSREPGFRPVSNEQRVRFAKDDPRITAAHRIWPEAE